jgi:hypothetical protein
VVLSQSLLGILLITDRKTRDHGHAESNLKKMVIMPELWLDDSIKGMELPTSYITLSKYEKEFCGVLEKCESTIQLLDERLKAYFISRSKSSFWCKVS